MGAYYLALSLLLVGSSAPSADKWIPSPAQQELCAVEKCVVVQEAQLEQLIRLAAVELILNNRAPPDRATCWSQQARAE